ncbi:DUF257 family protein [Palaeococcus ferrophilus]|uniref:DUF257 family protein n=1 Tax=Palaeococcus ferrophilus TaxID=83868 RepID=UPI00064EC177|nr:DUF257 family protein [Palaeococcus ferrophilus]
MRVENILDVLRRGETVLVEYNPLGEPETVFYSVVKYALDGKLPILVVDIVDTLHVFHEHLKLRGVEIPLESLHVVKEGGRVRLGRILGNVEITDDFDYHANKYSQVVRPFFERPGLKVVVVIGLEKFVLPFQHDPSKVEMYFERVARPPASPTGKITFLFINKKVASPYVVKSFEEFAQYVVELEEGINVVKSPLMGVEL